MRLEYDVNELIQEFSELTEKPTVFLSVQNELEEKFRNILKKLYDINKQTEDVAMKNSSTLSNLLVQNFDVEQIWQQIELQNQLSIERLNDRLALYISNNDVVPSDNDNDDDQKLHSDAESDSGNDTDSDFAGSDDVNEEESLLGSGNGNSDDEIDNNDENVESDDSIDYFQDIMSDEDELKKDENNKFGPMYNDFFEDPEVISKREKNQNDKKAVRFNLDEEISEGDEEKENFEAKSSLEKRQERLRDRIEKLESEALSEKPWYMTGEVTGKKRPANSLLEQNLEFDLTVRPAPIITEEVAIKLEDIIMQRIKDKSWDDVERKVKPVDAPLEFRKKLVLNQEKSKLSLAQIYEQEYLKRKEAANPEKTKEEEEPKEHLLIKSAMEMLFKKLDALSNYHYTPRPAVSDVKVINNLPAVTMEEAIPVTVSDATLVAPQEIIEKKKGDLVGKEERTATDKKRARRLKKLKQKQKHKEIEKKQKLMNKLKPGMAKKEKLRKEIEKLSKDKSISHFQEEPVTKQSAKSSKQFFEKLQETVSNKNEIKKRKKELKQFDAKKMKL